MNETGRQESGAKPQAKRRVTNAKGVGGRSQVFEEWFHTEQEAHAKTREALSTAQVQRAEAAALAQHHKATLDGMRAEQPLAAALALLSGAGGAGLSAAACEWTTLTTGARFAVILVCVVALGAPVIYALAVNTRLKRSVQ